MIQKIKQMIQKIKQTFACKSYKRVRTVTIIAVALICSITLSMVAASAISVYNVTVHDGGSLTEVSTKKSEPLAVLGEAGIVLGKNDLLDTSAFTQGEDSQLTIFRACDVKVIEDGKVTNLIGCKNVGYTLEKNAITLDGNDYVSVKLDTPVYENMVIVLNRAFEVSIVADGKTTKCQVTPGTVADAIQKAQIKLDKDDETNPSLKTELSSGMKIQVLRVEYALRTVTQTVEYQTDKVKTKNLYIGQTKVSKTGVNGKKDVVYKDRIVNGEMIKTSVVSETVTKKPVTQLKLVGTKQKLEKIVFKSGLSPISELKVPAELKLNTNGLPTEYSKVFEGSAKAYSGGGRTATGRRAMPGYIAVNPNQIPYGTKLYVVSLDGRYIYGYCIAADTGGFARTNSCTIDLYMDTEAQCNAWGNRGVRIYVL